MCPVEVYDNLGAPEKHLRPLVLCDRHGHDVTVQLGAAGAGAIALQLCASW